MINSAFHGRLSVDSGFGGGCPCYDRFIHICIDMRNNIYTIVIISKPNVQVLKNMVKLR
jgi:hypothetical protein